MARFMWKDIKKRILWEDDSMIILHKPSGLAVQSAKVGQMDLESLLRSYLHGGYVGLVHRLDQPVEGVMAAARTKEAAAELERQMTSGSFGKSYVAVVSLGSYAKGTEEDSREPAVQRIPDGKHVLEDYLLRDGRTNLSKPVPKGTPGAKKARLSYEVAAIQEQDDLPLRALLWVELETGRHHQIRVQLAHLGYPLLGDQKYGPVESADRPVSDAPAAAGMRKGALPDSFYTGRQTPALCAALLSFRHPVSGMPLSFGVLPENPFFSCFLDQIRSYLKCKAGENVMLFDDRQTLVE